MKYNPKFRRCLYGLKKDYKYYEFDKENNVFECGRGNLSKIIKYCEENNILYNIEYQLTKLPLTKPLKFNGKLRDYQVGVVEKIVESGDNGIIKLGTGFGKCFGYGTEILMYNGSIKKIENIKIGEKVMGDDSKPRKVLTLARGKEKMYKITSIIGESFICNESHILSMKWSGGKKHKTGDIIEMTVKDYLKLSVTDKHQLKLYKKPIEFNLF